MADNGQSKLKFLGKLKPKCCRKEGNSSLINPGHGIPKPPPPPSLPNHSQDSDGQSGPEKTISRSLPFSGQVEYQQPVEISYHKQDPNGPGYIRVTGGHQHTNWNSYDAFVPMSDIVGADKQNQGVILGAIERSRHGQYNGSPGFTGHYYQPPPPYTSYPPYQPAKAIDPPPPPPPPPAVPVALPTPTGKSILKKEVHFHDKNSAEPPKPSKCVFCENSRDIPDIVVKKIDKLNGQHSCFQCLCSIFGKEGLKIWPTV